MLRIVFVISSLRAGGAERVVSIMANYWAQKANQVAILTFSGRDETPFYDLSPAVEHVPLGLEHFSSSKLMGLRNNLHRVFVLRDALVRHHPDVVISFMDSANVLTLVATGGLQIPTIVSPRIDPAESRLDPIRRMLRRTLYPRAHAVVVQTARARSNFPVEVQRRCHVIPNPVPLPSLGCGKPIGCEVPGETAVAMGRLTEQKGFDLLLAAFAKLRGQFPEWRLSIVGEGPLRFLLEAQATELGIRDRVEFLGRVKQPEWVLKRASLFVLSSRYEGFPNALCEAMACGLPVVSFDCVSGPREIISDGVDGILVPPEDAELLAEAMGRLMRDESLRSAMGERAVDIATRFDLQKVMSCWDEVLQACLS